MKSPVEEREKRQRDLDLTWHFEQVVVIRMNSRNAATPGLV